MFPLVILAIVGLVVLRLFGINWMGTKLRPNSVLRVAGMVLGVIMLFVLWIVVDIHQIQHSKQVQAEQIRDAQARLHQQQAAAGK
jgi:uncharacterized membrane protein (DUF485 family)